MSYIGSLFKSKSRLNNYRDMIARGAKRKSDRLAVQPSEHLLNIMKSKEDTPILPDKYYPPWLFQMSHLSYDAYDSAMHLACGIRMPDPQDVVTFFRTHKRQNQKFNSVREYVKNNNKFLERYENKQIYEEEGKEKLFDYDLLSASSSDEENEDN